jgi:hypothetical protein
MARLRTRSYNSAPISGQYRTSLVAGWNFYSDLGVANNESVIDELHSFYDGHWSSGGPFDLTRSTSTWIGQEKHTWYFPNGLDVKGKGTVRIMNPSGTNPTGIGPYVHPSQAQLMADATTAIARIEPTQPAFDLSVFLGELRAEGLPNLPGLMAREQTKVAKAAGGEYLNIEFGWLPLVRGVRDFASTVAKSDEILSSYQEQSNQVLRRSYEWPTESESQAYSCTHVMNPGVGFFTGGGHHERITRRKWLEAEFMYYLPTGGSRTAKNQRFASYARKLLGVDLSPEVLWNLSPWSWAADWFGNVGDVMHNISAFGTDGMVMRNGYIMCHTNKTVTDSGSFAGQFQVRTVVTERKTRHVAHPYGFGVTDASLSARQLAIMAALGLSRT